MKKKVLTRLSFLLISLLASQVLFAHTLFMTVEDNEDETVTATGMFSTGSVASFVEVRLESNNGKVLWKSHTDEDGEITFEKLSVPYLIIMDAGPGHVVEKEGIQ